MHEVSQTAIGDSVGSLIEASLRAAGKQLSTHRLAGMRVPHNTGAITVDVTQQSRLFYSPKKGCNVGWRGLVFLTGPEVAAGNYEAITENWEEQIQAEWLSLSPFVVDGERLVKLGSLVHNPTLKYKCLDCQRTYNCAKLLAERLGNRHACGHCCAEAEKKFTASGQRLTGRDRMRIQAQYKLRHVVGTVSKPPTLGQEELASVKSALKQGPALQDYALPRPICMFQPGAVECLWEPEAGDTLGQQLVTRCRNANASQQPVPLRLALETYGTPPVDMPGLLGVVLLLAPHICGWRLLGADNSNDGWEIVLPSRNQISEPESRLEEV